MICPTCQSPNAPSVRFCSNCGTEISSPLSASSHSGSPNQSAAAASRVKQESPKVDEDEITRVGLAAGQGKTTVRDDSAAQDASLVIGRTIAAKYRLDAVIGTGGMGAVYRATRLLIGDQVAIKLLHQEHVSEAQASERFRREAQAAARLKHTNAVSIYDFGVTDDGPAYLVMELVEGQSLRRVIKEQGPLTPAAAAEILNQVCAALDEAHRHQIVHRDLKPDNIMVNPKITGLQVKVLDFGIAKVRDVAASYLTQSGSVLGTPHYMSPEQCLGEELDNRSDIYSLGVVLYEMLAGVVPFNALNSTAVVVQHVNNPPLPLRGINLNISPAVEAAVLHALAKRREDRPQSARAFAAEFSSAVASGLPPGVAHQAPRSEVAGAAVLNPTVVMNRTPAISGASQAYVGSIPSPQRRNSAFWIPLFLGGTLLLALGVIAGLLIDASKRGSANSDTVSTPGGGNANTADNRTMGGQSSPTLEPDRSISATPENTAPQAPKVVQPPPTANSDPRIPYSFRRNYRGTIGKGTGLLFALEKSGSTLEGRAETSGSWDQLRGTIQSDGSFKLDGFERGGRLTGVYRGRILPDGSVRGGTYASTEGKGRTTFQIR